MKIRTLAPVATPLLSAVLILCSCSAERAEEPAASIVEPEESPEVQPGSPTRLAESALSELFPSANVDSLAFWPGDDSTSPLVLATTKSENDLLVFDAVSLELLRRVGGPGSAAGLFQRPNGVAVQGGLAWVVERDNRRVQVLALPSFETVALIGAEQLVRPYGLALLPSVDGGLTLFVTDNELPETPESAVQPENRLVKFDLHPDRWTTGEVSQIPAGGRSIAPAEGDGLLLKVETLAVDETAERLVVAEEAEQDLSLKIFDFEGSFDRKINPSDSIRHEPEGLVLWRCPAAAEAGYWLLADQAKEATLFRVYSRTGFEHLGTFRGERTANTDGTSIAQPGSLDSLSHGALFAVHDDQAVSAFDLAAVAAALELPCL